MKRLLPFLLLASCNTYTPSRLVGANGSEINTGEIKNFAAKGTLIAGFDKNGNPRMVIRNDSEAVPYKAVETIGTVALGAQVASVQKAADAGATAITIGAQKTGVAKAKIAADEAVALGAQNLTEKITLPK